jgi:hypothetical protein
VSVQEGKSPILLAPAWLKCKTQFAAAEGRGNRETL